MADRPQAGQQSWEGEMFRLLAENVQEYAVFVVDAEGRVQTWSAGAGRLLGYREDEVIGQPADRFFTPEDVRNGVPRQEMQQALATVGMPGMDGYEVARRLRGETRLQGVVLAALTGWGQEAVRGGGLRPPSR
jgi:PAS domain S-box-containing protein